MRRLAGDDAADDAIVREHAANDGKRAKRANDADDKRDAAREYASSNIVEAARRLDAVVDAASRVVFVSAPEVSAALEVEPELDERLFKAFGVVAARCASLAKRCAQKNAALLGGSGSAPATRRAALTRRARWLRRCASTEARASVLHESYESTSPQSFGTQ